MSKKLPKKLFVRWNEIDQGSEFLMVGEEPGNLIQEPEEKVSAGVYELTGKVNLVNATKVVD